MVDDLLTRSPALKREGLTPGAEDEQEALRRCTAGKDDVEGENSAASTDLTKDPPKK